MQPDQAYHSQGTGFFQEVGDTVPKPPVFDPVARKHLWIVCNFFRCDPAALLGGAQLMMDRENLIGISEPGCYHCGIPYSTELASQLCKGDSDD